MATTTKKIVEFKTAVEFLVAYANAAKGKMSLQDFAESIGWEPKKVNSKYASYKQGIAKERGVKVGELKFPKLASVGGGRQKIHDYDAMAKVLGV